MSESHSKRSVFASRKALIPPRFDLGTEPVIEWLGGLRRVSVRQAAPALLVALEALRGADISLARRFKLLRTLKSTLLKICAALPKPTGSADPSEKTERHGLMLEQRLYRSMFQNLNHALQQLDRCYFMLDGRQARRRLWLVHNLYRFGLRQVRYASNWNVSVPDGTWCGLHDLRVYLSGRHEAWQQQAGVASIRQRYDPDTGYKELVLFGLAGALNGAGPSADIVADLREWAKDTRLVDPAYSIGKRGLFLLEIAEDAPPRVLSGALEAEFRGWVIKPPKSFLNAAQGIDDVVDIQTVPGGTWRSASGLA
jgi:hypothetical protein